MRVGALDLNGFTVRRYPDPRSSPHRIDDVSENFAQLHPEIQYDIRGCVVIQIGELLIRNDTFSVNILRYLNENFAATLMVRPMNEADVPAQHMHNAEARASARYQSVQQHWDYDRFVFTAACKYLLLSMFLTDHVVSADVCS